uniref:Exocyst complex component 7 n=1 Tax=Mesocestoides corti TaxID=53468 RepID=A0A5K3EVV3_MESCO
MSVLMSQVPSQMNQILALRDKFVEISRQSDEKLTSMIDAAKNFRCGMEPLKKEVDQLQTRVKNLEYCINGLSHVQNFYKTGREVEQIIIKGPSGSLEEYIRAMDRIKDSLIYFNQNNTEHLEYTRLNTLLSNGLKALNKRFEELLSQSFTTMPAEILYKLSEKEDNENGDENQPVLLECDSVSDEAVRSMLEISDWLRKAGPLGVVASTGNDGQKPHHHFPRPSFFGGSDSSGGGSYQLPESLAQYCDFRRDLMRVTLIKLREYQKSIEKNPQPTRARSNVGGSQLNLSTPGRRRGLKAVGIVWDVNSRRGVASDIRDVEDLDSEHYATSLSAFLILIERERLLLDRLKLAANSHEAHFAYSLICNSALKDLLNEGGTYVRLMSRVIGRGEFYMIVSLLTIMRRFIELSPSFVQTLKVVSTLMQPMTNLVNRFREQIKATFDAFLQQLAPGFGSSQVPPDATVHELASNVLLFLEKLMDYEITVGTVLTWEEAKVPQDATFTYLTTVTSKPKMARSAFGQYILRVTTSLVGNIDKKSEAYSDDLSRTIFQMNNLRYILTNLERTGLQTILNEYDTAAVDKLTRILNESKHVYTRACVCFFISHLL